MAECGKRQRSEGTMVSELGTRRTIRLRKASPTSMTTT